MKYHRIRTAAQIQIQARELRQRMTPSENKLWSTLRGRQIEGLKFRRQHPIGPYIVDFFCAKHRLVIEIDGAIHDCQLQADEQRTAELVVRGYKVIRFSNEEIENNLGGVLEIISRSCSDRPKE